MGRLLRSHICAGVAAPAEPVAAGSKALADGNGQLVPPSTFLINQHLLQVTGMVERAAEFTVPELINLLPSYTIPVTLVCAGRRHTLAAPAPLFLET